MLRTGVKYPKQDVEKSLFPGYSKISQFSRQDSSLFQSLSVGIIEILLRFRLKPDEIKCLSHELKKIKKIALELSSYSDYFIHLENLFKIIENVLWTYSLPIGFIYLAYYSENVENHANLALDYGMRLFICGLLLGRDYIHKMILDDMQLTDDLIELIFHSLSTTLRIAILVFKPDGTKSMYKRDRYTYPLISLYNDNQSYILLYSDKTAEIELNSNFNPEELELIPFVDREIRPINLKK